MNSEDLRTVGVVAGAHGLQGTLKLTPLSDFPERYEALRTVYLKRGETVLRRCRVRNARWARNMVLITLAEITTPEAAEELRGTELCVAEEDTWKLPEDVYYVSDLLGFAGIGEDGTAIGILRDVLHSAQDILQFELPNGDELLVPLVHEWVGRVDLEKRTIELLNWRRLVEPESDEGGAASDDH